MNKTILMAFILMILTFSLYSQEKQPLTHDVYDKWELISGVSVSNDGSYLLYNKDPQRLDGRLILTRPDNGFREVFPRGAKAAFSPLNKYIVFHIEPEKETVRQAKVEKTRRADMPTDSLGIFLLDGQQLITYLNVASYQLPERDSHWMAFIHDHERVIEKENEDADDQRQSDKSLESLQETDPEEQEEEKPKTEKIKRLVIKNPVDNFNHIFEHVEHYRLAENGSSVIFLEDKTDDKDTLKVRKLFYFDTSTQTTHLLDSAAGEFTQLAVSKDGSRFAWLFTADTTDVKVYDLLVHETGRRARRQSISDESQGMPEGFAVSQFRRPAFSDDNSRLFFGTAPIPPEQPEDTLLDEEKFKVDIWHWQDPFLQSQQRVRARQERQRNYETVLFLRNGRLVPLAQPDMPQIVKDPTGNAPFVVGFSNLAYQRESSWVAGIPRDVYSIDVTNGERKPVFQRAQSTVQLSPGGRFILYYNPDEANWFVYENKAGNTRNVTAAIPVPLYNEENDLPRFANPHGLVGWMEDDRAVLIYDRYDIWKIDLHGNNPPVNLTRGYGRENNIRFRYQNLTPDEHYIPDDLIWLSAFNQQTKQDGYYRLNMASGELTSLLIEDALFTQLSKSKDSDVFVYRRSTFTDFPDVWVSKPDFSDAVKISEANPWQKDYLWGSVELVEWKDFNNNDLQGLLYLPEDFDPEAKYPLIVYFYERSSQNKHRHRIPSPSRSTINPSYCTSNGYVVFVPDIVYEIGFPGRSAYKAIVSGTQSMTERYPFIDRDRMALQGQSWGGYQIAYLVTKTNMFRAAMAGAPVSNMVSAYGGIRWATGLSRQFQYEQTQSRIGGTLWEKPFHYIENSPIFFAEDIHTPLLMMHNDDDGAVPWYQGIELFVAMRRLDKPVWMLVYNDEAHNLREWPARIDLSVRMYQFFDHYLKDKPMPVWMKEGIPFIYREHRKGYELVE